MGHFQPPSHPIVPSFLKCGHRKKLSKGMCICACRRSEGLVPFGVSSENSSILGEILKYALFKVMNWLKMQAVA